MTNRYGTCVWRNLDVHRVAEGQCYLQNFGDSILMDSESKRVSSADMLSERVHVYKDSQYSTDPSTGLTVYNRYSDQIGEEIILSDFRLNKRLCTISTLIESGDVHIMTLTRLDSISFWSVINTVYLKWIDFNRYTGGVLWPSKSTAVDILYNLHTDELRGLRPVRFSESPDSLAKGLLELIKSMLINCYIKELDKLEMDDTHMENILNDASASKLRLFECRYHLQEAGFNEKYRSKTNTGNNNADNLSYESTGQCLVKGILDELSLRDGRVFSILNSRKLFHSIIIRLFGGHRDHIHMILCKQYLISDKAHSQSWLNVLKAFLANRLNANESSRVHLGVIIKDFKRLYPSILEIDRQRKRNKLSISRRLSRDQEEEEETVMK